MNKVVSILKKIGRKFFDRNEAFNQSLRAKGAKVGKNVQIVDRKKFLYEPWYADLIELGDEVVLAAGVRLVNHDSSYANVVGDLPVKYGKVIIGKKTYVGVNSVILPGVEIGENCLIGAGSIVNKSIPPNSVAVGNPVRIISSIEEGLLKYKSRLNEKNNLYGFIDLGGSNSQIIEKHGSAATDYILDKYKEFIHSRKDQK